MRMLGAMPEGENALIEWLRRRFPADPVRVAIGLGDDAAAVRLDHPFVVITADMLLDGVHFLTGEHGFELIGRKAVACSLSDCAAMACWPRAATVSVALPNSMPVDAVKRLYEGMAVIADEFGCAIVGGDTTSWNGRLAIDVAMLAEPMAPRGPVRRSDARAGDTMYVSGPLGGSIAGKHLTFTPRIHLASRLVLDPASRLVPEPVLHAMMDVSDGLALDLHRLCTASHCDAELSPPQVERVISDAARRLSESDGRSPLDHALSDGEDFELLIAAGGDLRPEDHGLFPIGTVTPRADPARSAVVMRHPDGRVETVEPRGYEHFR